MNFPESNPYTPDPGLKIFLNGKIVPAEQATTIVEDFEGWSNGSSEGSPEAGSSAVKTYQYETTDEGEKAVAAIDFRPLVAIHGG